LPHNIFIEAGSELGYSGLVAFILLIIATFVINYRTRQLTRRHPGGNLFMFDMAHGLDGALIGYLASGFFVTVLYYPFFWINFAMTVALHRGTLNKLRDAGGSAESGMQRTHRRIWRGAPKTAVRRVSAL
jgi:hypothetical protein